MIAKAIEKIKTEMEQNKDKPYIQVIGEFILTQLKNNPASAEKVLEDGKTLVKSFEEMRKAAQKKKVGNCAVLTDQEGFEIVLKYFGIDTKAVQNVTRTSKYVTKTTKNVTKSVDFDVKLEDLL